MSQLPPSSPPSGVGYAEPMTASQKPPTSGAALASLITGILGCVPFLTSLIAIVLGIIGLRATSGGRRSGRGMAIAGLLLGIVGVIGWGLMSGTIAVSYLASNPARAAARQCMQDVADGKLDAAAAKSTLTVAQLTAISDHVKQRGSYSGISFTSYNISYVNGQSTANLTAASTYSSGAVVYTFTMIKSGDGWKVSAVHWAP